MNQETTFSCTDLVSNVTLAVWSGDTRQGRNIRCLVAALSAGGGMQALLDFARTSWSQSNVRSSVGISLLAPLHTHQLAALTAVLCSWSLIALDLLGAQARCVACSSNGAATFGCCPGSMPASESGGGAAFGETHAPTRLATAPVLDFPLLAVLKRSFTHSHNTNNC